MAQSLTNAVAGAIAQPVQSCLSQDVPPARHLRLWSAVLVKELVLGDAPHKGLNLSTFLR